MQKEEEKLASASGKAEIQLLSRPNVKLENPINIFYSLLYPLCLYEMRETVYIYDTHYILRARCEMEGFNIFRLLDSLVLLLVTSTEL